VPALDCQGLSKIRQPDRSVLVRTFPVTFLHDVTQTRCDPAWHVLIYSLRGHLEVVTGDVSRLVPADRAVWIPAGTTYTSIMRAPIAMRSLFVAAAHAPRATTIRTIGVAPLLRELILHITRLGAIDRSGIALATVLTDLVALAPDITFDLPLPRDPRARRFANLVAAAPGDPRSLPALARAAGASVRTLERCFLAETALSIGAWRRRVRLFHALHLLEGGAPVTAVALDVGYSSASAFACAFARQFGHPPTRRARANVTRAGAYRSAAPRG
jgi:AraC-like DNA-binding protein